MALGATVLRLLHRLAVGQVDRVLDGLLSTDNATRSRGRGAGYGADKLLEVWSGGGVLSLHLH
jgi:hypothetical protein